MDNQLMVANSAQVPQELMHLKSGEQKYELAVEGNVIIASPLEKLKEVLRLVMLKVGLRSNNLPDDEEKGVLLLHIIENYGKHTCEEIKLAFDLALEGKLDLEMREVKTYENFSCLYFSTIMNAYRVWTHEPFLKYKKKKEQLALPYEQRESLTEQDMEDWIKEFNVEKLKTINVNYIPLMFYDYLVGKNLLLLSNEQKVEYFKKAALHKKQEYELVDTDNKFMTKMISDFILEFNRNEFSRGNLTQLRQLAKKISVLDYLKNRASEAS